MLAAGRGARVDPITRLLPKPLISCAGLATIDRLIQSLRAAGVEGGTLGVGWKGEMIVDHLEPEIDSGFLQVVEVPEWKRGPLQTLVTSLETVEESPFIMCPADLIVRPENISSLISTHLAGEGAQLLTLSVDESEEEGTRIQLTQDGNLAAIGGTAPTSSGRVRSAMLIAANWTFREFCSKALVTGATRVREAVNLALESGEKAGVDCVAAGSWRDLDDIDSYLEANRNLLGAMSDSGSGGLYLHPRDTLEIGHTVESESGLSLGVGTQIVGPVYIAGNVSVGTECRIGPNVSMGLDTVVADRCVVRECMLFGNAKLPTGKEVHDALVCNETILEKEVSDSAK
ncbi:MAG: NTP transferase domain-containing protein [Candidatus Thorarchaeota archaeon]